MKRNNAQRKKNRSSRGRNAKAAGRSCLFCGKPLRVTFVDLGMSPLCESYVDRDHLNSMEPFYPLHVYVCEHCLLVQLNQYVSPEDIFSEYAYFSSYSESWVEHARVYTEMAIERFGLSSSSHVVELASNDGYLLQHFVRRGIPVLGVEPAANIARVARQKKIPTLIEFFGVASAQRLKARKKSADLIVGNNVLAQVPDINDFVRGIKILLKPRGVVTIEFPHLLRLMEQNQFDTIYHEHFFYFSFASAERVFRHHGLELFDVEELPTHGGSLRIFAHHANDKFHSVSARVHAMKAKEKKAGLHTVESYAAFSERVRELKREILEFFIDAKVKGKRIAGYGAPGKGNTLLNYCGIRSDFLEYTVDRNSYKQGKYLPGTHIPIYAPDRIRETKPDIVFILPWNFKDEIMRQMSYIREWGGVFAVPIPSVTMYR